MLKATLVFIFGSKLRTRVLALPWVQAEQYLIIKCSVMRYTSTFNFVIFMIKERIFFASLLGQVVRSLS